MGYNKKVLSEATANLNKRKAPVQKKDIIVDPRGQWAHPGQPTRIPGNNITMQGVPYPVYGIDNTGFAQMMYPGQDYQFQGDYVDEYPMARKGGSMPKIPKKKDSKGYSRSITATNRLFAQNPLTKKTKSKKRKVFDPNAKYYQDGGDISIPELAQAQEGGDYYTFQGTNYMKQDGKWFKDINGTYMPLTKGDVAKRSAVLDAQARKLSPYELEQRARRQAGVSKYNPLTQKTIPSETTQLNVPTSNVSIDKALREKSAQRQATIEAVKQQPLLSEEKKSEILMDPRKLEEYDYLTRMSDPGTVTQKKEQSWDNRLRDYALNPDAAIYYAMSGKDMPSNYQAMIEAGIDPMAGERGGNTVLKALNTVNPLVALNDVQRATSQGNYGEAGIGLLGFIPGFKQARALKKGLDVVNSANDIKHISKINDLKRAGLKDEFTDLNILMDDLAKKSNFATDQEAADFIKAAQKNYTKSDDIMYDYINRRNWGFPNNLRAVAHIIKNDLHPPINSYMYHGTTSTRLKDIMSRGLDNSLGDELNPGVMTRLNKGETTAAGDIDYARGFARTSAEKTKGSPVILRFPNVNNYDIGYIGEHASPSKLEYSLDDGTTWLTDYKKGGYIQTKLTKAQEGMTTGQCPPGQKPDGKGGCILIEEKDLEEAVVYGDPAKDKQQTSLMNKFRQVKGAYQDWRENAGLTQRQLRNEGASSIEGLKRQIADYKKELEEEKKAYDKASKALNVLKKNRPDEWKDAKINDVLSGEGIEALRSLYSEGKVSRESFMNFYDSFGKDFDPNVIEGKGRGQAYSAKEAEQEWMENVPEFADNVQDLVKFITGVAATGGLGELLAPAAPLMNPAATATRAASPFMQAAKAAYKAPIQFGRFGSVPGLTPANIATGYWIGSELMNAPEVLTSVREGVKGEKEWSDVATETGEFVAGVATSGFPFVRAAKELKPGAQAVTKLLDRPFSTYTLLNKPFKAVTTNPAYQRFTRFAGSKYPKFLGQIRNLETMTPADLLKFQTVESTLSNLPGTIENIGSDVNTALDSNLSPAERLLAAGSAGRSTLMSTLGVLPIFRKTAPLYSTNFANRAFLVDNLIKSGIEDDVQGARAIFNASRLLSKQEGGATDTYIDELPQKKIDQLIKQGYKIEYLD
jgi:hypothetical protein